MNKFLMAALASAAGGILAFIIVEEIKKRGLA